MIIRVDALLSRWEWELPRDFTKQWRPQQPKAPLHSRIKEAVSPQDSVKQRIDLATKRMELQIQRLERSSDVLSRRDQALFTKVVSAYSKRDMLRAAALASELAEVRKIEKVIAHARLALEQIILRFRTVIDFGDTVGSLAPTVNVLRSLKNGMSGILPAAEREFGEIGDLLQGIVTDSNQGTGLNINFEAESEDSHNILREAAAAAEKKISKELPEIPPEVVATGESHLKQAEQPSSGDMNEMEGSSI